MFCLKSIPGEFEMKHLLIILMTITLAACMSPPDIRKTGTIDLSNKSIAVPPGSAGSLGPIKDDLTRAGWRVTVKPDATARYTLLMSEWGADPCVTGGVKVTYDIAVVDQRSNTEVLTMNGSGCSPDVAAAFTKALAG